MEMAQKLYWENILFEIEDLQLNLMTGLKFSFSKENDKWRLSKNIFCMARQLLTAVVIKKEKEKWILWYLWNSIASLVNSEEAEFFF